MHKRLRRFFSYYRPYRGLLAADIACALIAAAVSLALPQLIQTITAQVQTGGTADAWPLIARVGGVMLLLIALQAACNYFYDYRGHAMGAMMERDMRRELFDHYQRLPLSFHTAHSPAQLMTRLTHDLLMLAELYHHGPEDLAVYLVKFVGAAAILLITNGTLALAALALLPAILLFSLFIGRRMYAAMRDNLQHISDINAQVEETLSGISVVQSFANEALEREKFAGANERYLGSRSMIYRREAQFFTGVQTLTQLISVLVVTAGGLLISRQQLNLAELITFLLYISHLTEPVTRLAFIIQQYQEGIAGFNRFMDIIEIPPAIADPDAPKALARASGMVGLCGVGFTYPDSDQPILRDITLHVAPRTTVALVGHSGVGKTTLCSLIPRLHDVSEGSIRLDGIDIRDVSLQDLRRNIAVVQQDVYLFSGTILENIRYGRPQATDAEVFAAAQRANAHGFILGLPDGYATQVGHRGQRLSGGERQRISIARAFLKDPPILILDEATSALDTESELAIRASLAALSKNRTTFIIAHRMSTVRGADRIVVLSDTGIAEEGSHEVLMARDGVYASLYRGQMIE